jgi:hypothetical protein
MGGLRGYYGQKIRPSEPMSNVIKYNIVKSKINNYLSERLIKENPVARARFQ